MVVLIECDNDLDDILKNDILLVSENRKQKQQKRVLRFFFKTLKQ